MRVRPAQSVGILRGMAADPPSLALDDPRWRELHECFGPAVDVPKLLRRLADPSSANVWDDMFTHLCHQGTAYSASYAAVPHVVRIAESTTAGERLMPLFFIASVEYWRLEQTKDPAPPWVMEDYHAAIERARRLTCESMSRGAVSDLDARHLLYACAVFMGKPRIAFVIEDLPNLECPSCGEGMLAPSAE